MRKAFILKFFLFSILSVCGATAQFDSQQQTDSQQQQQPDRQSIPGMSVTRPSTGVSITNLGQGGSAADRELLREEQQAQQDAAEEKKRIDEQEAEIRNLPPEPDIEFQFFVAGTLGYPLQIFGHDLFHNMPSTFAPLDRVPVTPDYLIGPGDELLIHAWGQIDVNFRATVDRTGSIYVPKVGAISVAGVRYDQLEDHLRAAISRVFKNFNINVTLGRLRSIQVFMVGQVRRPGSYTVSSLSTLVNVLFASGGISKRGSMRNIVLKREGKEVTRFDLYDLIVRGDKSKDVQLLPGDVIYVPPVGNLVALAGSVNVPGIFELKDHETLNDVLTYAGGVTTTANGQKVFVDRIDEHNNRRTAEFNLDATGLKTPLRDGDVVRFLHISPRFDNAVTLRGNVAVPGRYPWHQGMRVKDLIPNREFLITEKFWNSQNILGINEDSTTLQPPPQPAPQPSLGTPGAAPPVPQATPIPPPPQPDTTNMSRSEAQRITEEALKNQVRRSAAEINWEYAVVQRMNPDDLTTHLLPFNLGKAIAGDDQQNLVLEPGDIVTIFSQSDMQVPIGQQSKFVRLEGEFHSAGVYQVQPGETLRHLIARVGGLTPQAYLYGAEFTRESVREDQQERLDQYVNELDRSIEQNAGAQRGLSPDEALAERQAQEGQRRLVDKLRQVRATGRIVLQLRPNGTLNDLPDLVLEDGDRFLVPFRPATVNVIGAVYNTNSFIYKPGHTFGDYLKLSGGATKNGDKGRSFIIRADGTTLSKYGHGFLANFDSTRLMAGDTIVVPEKLDKGAVLRGFKDWTLIISQFVLGAAAAKVLF
ncbi:MAG TPA: polysaccharide biosynthesis/export family protein [Candidatus Angelobacter sp.]|nr:polysaccharide biosynthesis/export family protein [Candidatus Angelobacter sp.]